MDSLHRFASPRASIGHERKGNNGCACSRRPRRISRVLWDLDDDPEGNVQHIAEHGLTVDEVEDVWYAAEEVVASQSSGRPITFGETYTGKQIAVVFEIVDEDPLVVCPVTAYETES